METTIFLVRHGRTDWQTEGRVMGTRDIGLNADGINETHAIVRAFENVDVAEVLSSPLRRAVQSAEIIAGAYDLEIARDPRLADVRVGRWEGMHYRDLANDPDYQRYLADPLSERTPGGEHISEIRDRAVASVQQALGDNPGGENVVVVTHAGIIRTLIVHYMGATLANYHRVRVAPGSISILRFASDRELPRVLAINLPPGGGLRSLLH
ncbi:MAG TPA: histidine phosphatase family protein [Polyangia bacterium]|nr:histidine phosphatase family protein [Polyangia bacterium]